mmetsp:Transcript_929/g.946  ORF Transcript_929/g.946 Transcript_929/m.946 type:complete len:86 (+) Transcript_929:146-403(+)
MSQNYRNRINYHFNANNNAGQQLSYGGQYHSGRPDLFNNQKVSFPDISNMNMPEMKGGMQGNRDNLYSGGQARNQPFVPDPMQRK